MNSNAIKYSGVLQINTVPDTSVSGTVMPNQIVALSAKKGHSVSCTSGLLWVTVQGDPMDHVLSANETLAISGDGKLILSGLKSAGYRIR